MTIERTNPGGLHPTPGYHHVTKVQAETLIYLAGQCPLQPSGELADGGIEGQTAQVIRNILTALESDLVGRKSSYTRCASSGIGSNTFAFGNSA